MAVAQIPERGGKPLLMSEGRCGISSDDPSVEIQNLSLPQLGSVKKQLDDELEHLTISFSKLRTAQNKFRDCIKSIQSGVRPEIAGQRDYQTLSISEMNLNRLYNLSATYDLALRSRNSNESRQGHCGCWHRVLCREGNEKRNNV